MEKSTVGGTGLEPIFSEPKSDVLTITPASDIPYLHRRGMKTLMIIINLLIKKTNE